MLYQTPCYHACAVFIVVRVYIGDLGNNGDPEDLRRIFSRYGSVQDVWVAHKPPGFAFVFYKTVREAREAVKGADGRLVCGVRVRVRMGTEINPSETHQHGRSFEREYDSPPRERNRGGSLHHSKSYQQSRGPRHGERSGRNYEQQHTPPPSRSSPPRSSSSGWSSRGSGRSMPRPHPSSTGYAKSSHIEDSYSPSSHSKYGAHKRGHEPSSHYPPPNDRYSSREGGRNRITRHHRSSPDRFSRFSPPPTEVIYHGNKRTAHDRFERHEAQQFDYKDKHQRNRRGGHKEPYTKIPSHHQHHRSRSPHSFSPPPARQRHDRRHDNKGGWSYSSNHSPPAPPPSRRSHRDDNHDHRGYRERVSHDEPFEARSFTSDRGDRGSGRKNFMYDDGRTESRYSGKEHLYKSADREVKYKGRQQPFPASEHYSRQEEYHEPYVVQERVEYLDNRSDRGSSLEGVGLDDDFSDVIIECDPNDLRRKLLNEGDTREVREASSSERG